MKSTALLRLAIIAALCGGTAAAAQDNATVFAYPGDGQSAELQARDRFECHEWAVDQTGFNPKTARPIADATYPSYPSRPRYRDRYERDRRGNSGIFGIGDGGFIEGGGVIGDAATGAAIGAAGGAIAGNAGKGAAWGAIGGTLLGALSRSAESSNRGDDREQREYERRRYEEQRDYERGYGSQAERERRIEEREMQVDAYRRAYGACMRARNYTVE